jgi:parallel beta-helix repeat protein
MRFLTRLLMTMLLAMIVFSPLARADGGRGDDGTPGRRPMQRVVDCSCGDTLTGELPRLRPGDTVLLRGACNENVDFNSPTSQFDGIVLDGGGTASLIGASASLNTLQLDNVRNFTVQNLTISGGRDGIAIDTGNLVALNNITVTAVGRHGIHYQRMSSGFVVNSTVRGNPGNGIIVNENSYVRIGFTNGIGASEGDVGPNTITGNTGFGIRVQRQSGVRVYTNTISNNGNSGVHVESFSYAEVASNTIDANGDSGVFVAENSVVHLGNATGVKVEDTPNTTNTPNAAFGLTAQGGAYVQGRLGTLVGASGGSTFKTSANNQLTP